MLAIRLQRTGRSGHAQFRLIVQDSRYSPTSGRVTAYLGSYNPHNKLVGLDKEKVEQYLKNGAQPSDRVARLLKKEGIKLPDWVKIDEQKQQRAVRNPDKLRRNRPAGAAAPEPTPEAVTTNVDEAPAETPQPEIEAASEKPEEKVAAVNTSDSPESSTESTTENKDQ